MARAAIIVALLAVVLNAQCFGACVANAAQQSKSCHHNQKRSVERCEYNQLITDKATPSENPLTVATFLALTAPPMVTTQSSRRPLTQSPSPPIARSITILKI